MAYLVDGHNLIPKIPGLSLREIDDEARLVEMLGVFCRRRGKNLEVYFDKAPPGQARSRKFGRVKAVFVRQGTTADEAIRRRLSALGGEARNWTVVSSDRQVQAEARAVRAQVISSADFARQLTASADKTLPEDQEQAPLTPAEVEDWLRLFEEGGAEGEL